MENLAIQEFDTKAEFSRERYTLDDFPGLREFRDYMVHAPGEFCIERALLKTRFLKEKGFDYTDPIIRQAEAMKFILENKKPTLWKNDLLAGSTTSKRKGVLFYPEFLAGGGIWPELLSMQYRRNNPYKISIKEVMLLDGEIYPYWMDKNVAEVIRKRLGDDDPSYKLHELFFLYMVSKFNCQSHTIPDYKRVLERGLEDLIKEAKKRKAETNAADEKNFYQALITVMEGVIQYSNHLADEAERQANNCTDDARRKQLLQIAKNCRNVPAKPAKTFWEGVQSIWTCMNALYQEQNNVGFSIGRIDQLLNDLYVNDIKNNRLTRKQAIEILAHFWLKVGDNLPLVPEAGELLFGGTGSNQAITIGGCDRDGNNAVNELTYLCLDVVELVKVRDPNLNARVREDDPPEYTQRLAEVIINTGATPSLINDKAVIPALQKTGVSLEDARDYAQVGCLEPNSACRTFGHTGAILINLTAPLELTLLNGNSTRHDNVGLKTGSLDFILDNAIKLNNMSGEVLKYVHPQPLLSALFEGPMESGKSLLHSGAKYNSSGIAFIALADLIDSLYAIKKLVFEEKRLTLKEFVDVLKSNYESRPDILAIVRNKLEHFGNGVESVDAIGNEIVDFLYNYCQSKKN
ncbi:MAG: pyruvate formate lyase family protein, partial [Promethearchaeota archaeon]